MRHTVFASEVPMKPPQSKTPSAETAMQRWVLAMNFEMSDEISLMLCWALLYGAEVPAWYYKGAA
jgi:hypothetical protein